MAAQTYKPITYNQEKEIKALFKSADTFEVSTEKDGYHIHIVNMYNYVSFTGCSTLVGYHKIAEILGVSDGDEEGRYSSPGCSTCDYGSRYTVDLRFW